MPRSPRFEMFEMRRLRIDQQAGGDREGRPLGRLRQPGDAERPADADRPVEDARGELRQAGELAGAAGQDDARARLGRERRSREAVAHHFQNFLDARLDDAHQTARATRTAAARARRRRPRGTVIMSRSSEPAAEHAAIERLDSLGIGDAGVQAARQVHGDVVAAEREAVGMDEAAAGEHRDGGGAGAHVDHARRRDRPRRRPARDRPAT